MSTTPVGPAQPSIPGGTGGDPLLAAYVAEAELAATTAATHYYRGRRQLHAAARTNWHDWNNKISALLKARGPQG